MVTRKRVIFLFAALAPAATSAAEMCVSCVGPDATYRCEAEGFGPGDNRATWVCVTELAKLEGHKSCGVDRRAAGPCDGPLKIVQRDLGGLEATLPEQTASGAADDGGARPGDEPAAPPPAIAAAPTQGMGQSIGTATQKAWNCLASFMQKC